MKGAGPAWTAPTRLLPFQDWRWLVTRPAADEKPMIRHLLVTHCLMPSGPLAIRKNDFAAIEMLVAQYLTWWSQKRDSKLTRHLAQAVITGLGVDLSPVGHATLNAGRVH